MSALPKPLTPPGSDLRDFPYMPVDIVRLFQSKFHAYSNDAEWRAGVTLWLKSFHQVPAGSLPDNEIALTRLAELGQDVKKWRKVREGALRGWVKCGDGNLYHATVAEKVLEAWIAKLAQRRTSGLANAKRWSIEFDSTEVDGEILMARDLLKDINPQSSVFKKAPPKPITSYPSGNPSGMPDGTPSGIPDGSPSGNPDGVPEHSQGRGREKGNVNQEGTVVTPNVVGAGMADNRTAPLPPEIPEIPTAIGHWANFFIREGFHEDRVHTVSVRKKFGEWVEQGVTLTVMREAMVCGDAKNAGRPDSPLWYSNFVVEVLKPRPAAKPAWWSSDQAMLDKLEELGLPLINGEGRDALKARIQDAIDNGGKPRVQRSRAVHSAPAPEQQEGQAIDKSPAAVAARREALRQAFGREGGAQPDNVESGAVAQ